MKWFCIQLENESELFIQVYLTLNAKCQLFQNCSWEMLKFKNSWSMWPDAITIHLNLELLLLNNNKTTHKKEISKNCLSILKFKCFICRFFFSTSMRLHSRTAFCLYHLAWEISFLIYFDKCIVFDCLSSLCLFASFRIHLTHFLLSQIVNAGNCILTHTYTTNLKCVSIYQFAQEFKW